MVPPRLDVMVMVLVLAASGASGAGRVRARLRPAAADDELLYRADERTAAAAADDRVVLVSADDYNLYRADERLDYEPRAQQRQQPRDKEPPKPPPVQTIRNYNKVNDDGSFTFGYEAADGSFKEETRGTDCVVRGKYGYVDPDGNKREFTYVSGNPCDPNRPDEESGGGPDSAELDDDEPANYPSRPPPPPPQRATTPRPQPTAYFQNDFRDDEEEEPAPQVRQRVVQRPRPAPLPRPTYAPIAITPRPQSASTPRALPPATTFRPQLVAIPQATPRPEYRFGPSPSPTYATSAAPQYASPRPTSAAPVTGPIDFAAEFAKFQRDNGVAAQSTAAPALGGERPAPRPAGSPLYSTELVFDPASGQYDTQLFQALPQTSGDLNLNGRLQSYVAQPQPRPFVPSQRLSASPQPQQAPLFRHQIDHAAPQRNPQEAYQRQQAESQFQNSAQLFAQQQQLQHSQLQRDRAAARLQAQQLSLGSPASPAPPRAPPAHSTPQQYYYVRGAGGGAAPAGDASQSSGQIDAFLRGHGIQF